MSFWGDIHISICSPAMDSGSAINTYTIWGDIHILLVPLLIQVSHQKKIQHKGRPTTRLAHSQPILLGCDLSHAIGQSSVVDLDSIEILGELRSCCLIRFPAPQKTHPFLFSGGYKLKTQKPKKSGFFLLVRVCGLHMAHPTVSK